MSETREARLETIATLYGGIHDQDGRHCVMEAAAFVAGEPWSDSPECVSPVIAAFLRNWNDALRTDEERTRLLRPLILPALDTTCDAATDARLAWMAVDWLTRVQTPAWLRLTMALRAHAEVLAGLPEITVSSWPAARPTVDAAWDAARAAAGAAARAAAGDAARDAARAAAWAAAWAAARAAAGDAAGDAARAAARDVARAAAGDAARDATGDAAWAAAWDAARAAAGAAARAAAGAAGWAELEPTVTELQDSAVALVLRMCRIAKGEDGG